MKKRLTALLVLMNLLALSAMAQVSTTPIILEEDEAGDIDSLGVLVETMNKHGNILALDAKRVASWKRKGYFRLAYTSTKTSPSGTLPAHLMKGTNTCLDGVNDEEGLYKFSNKIGVSMMWGRSFSLHKKPIANILRFALDYTWVDLNWNQYETFYGKNGSDKKYNTSLKYTQTDEDGIIHNFSYTPWGLGKNEINYGMSLGPSITVAPFGASQSAARSLHLQGYFHVGYSGSVFLMSHNKKYDTDNQAQGFVGLWGIGLNTSWGINLSYKAIGLGFEQRTADFSYKSFDTETYGGSKTNFKQKETRIYLSYNF